MHSTCIVLAVPFDFTHVTFTMCERRALSPIDVKGIVLLHTMQIAFFESPLTCLTHLYSSIVNHSWLKLHFPGILQRNQQQRNV